MPCGCPLPNPVVSDDSDALPLQQAVADYLYRRKFWRPTVQFDVTHAGTLKVLGSRAPAVIDKELFEQDQSSTLDDLRKIADRDDFHVEVVNETLVFVPAKRWRKNPSKTSKSKKSDWAKNKRSLQAAIAQLAKEDKLKKSKKNPSSGASAKSMVSGVRVYLKKRGLLGPTARVGSDSENVWVTWAGRNGPPEELFSRKSERELRELALARGFDVRFDGTTLEFDSGLFGEGAERLATGIRLFMKRKGLSTRGLVVGGDHDNFYVTLPKSLTEAQRESIAELGPKFGFDIGDDHYDGNTMKFKNYEERENPSKAKWGKRHNPTFRVTPQGKVIARLKDGRRRDVTHSTKHKASVQLTEVKLDLLQGKKPKTKKKFPKNDWQSVKTAAMFLRYGKQIKTAQKKAAKVRAETQSKQPKPPKQSVTTKAPEQTGTQVSAWDATVAPFVMGGGG